MLGVGLYLRLPGIEKGIWLDEAYTLDTISGPDFVSNLRAKDHPPLYYLLLKLWSFGGESWPYLRLLSVCFGLGAVAVVIKWLKRDSAAGSLLAGLLCATLPLMVVFSQELKGYPLLVLTTALSFHYGSVLAAEPERLRGYVGLTVSLVASVATHAVGALCLPSVLVYAVLRLGLSNLKRVRVGWAIAAAVIPSAVFVLLFSFFLQAADKDAGDWWMPQVSMDHLYRCATELGGIPQIRAWLWTFAGAGPAMTNVIAFVTDANAELPIMLLLLVALIPLGDWRRSLPSLAACLTYWGAMVVYSLATMPILYPRTMLAGMVPFIGFVGLQVGTIRRRWLKLLVAAGVIALCFVFADNWVRSGGGKIKEDWDEAAFQLNSRREGEVVTVLFPELVRTPLKYYVDLPTESTILVSDDAEFTESQLRDLTARIKSQLGAGSTALFLVTRSGQTENYRTLVDSLKSEFGEPVFSWKSGNLGVAKYAARRPAP